MVYPPNKYFVKNKIEQFDTNNPVIVTRPQHTTCCLKGDGQFTEFQNSNNISEHVQVELEHDGCVCVHACIYAAKSLHRVYTAIWSLVLLQGRPVEIQQPETWR